MKVTKSQLKELIKRAIVEDIMDKEIENPKTGNKIKIRTALQLPDEHPANKKAKDMVAKAGIDKDDVGGPSYPKVPKGVKTSADAKGVMKAKQLAKKGMEKGDKDIEPEIDKKAMSAADAANAKMDRAERMEKTDDVARSMGYKHTAEIVKDGTADEIGDFMDTVDDIGQNWDEVNYYNDLIRDNEMGVTSQDDDVIMNYRRKIFDLMSNKPKGKKNEGGPGSGPKGNGDEDNPFDREPSDDELADIEKDLDET